VIGDLNLRKIPIDMIQEKKIVLKFTASHYDHLILSTKFVIPLEI
jgi:hypothetical protein